MGKEERNVLGLKKSKAAIKITHGGATTRDNQTGIFSEANQRRLSEQGKRGGTISGPKNLEARKGIHDLTYTNHIEDGRKAGRAGSG